MKNNFFRMMGHALALPFAFPYYSFKCNRINKRAIKYRNNPEDFEKVKRYQDCYSVCKGALFVLNCDIEVRGAEHLVKRPMFFVPNHKSNIDPLILIVKLWELKGFPYYNMVAKKEVMQDRWGKGVLELLDSILIDRDNLRDIVRVVKEETERLRENSVVCFLEGTRIRGDKIGELKAAGLEPAYKALVPIVPVVIYGTDGCLWEDDKHKGKYKKIIVEFLEPIKHTSYGKESKEYFAEKIHKKMQECYDKLKAEVEGGDSGRDSK